MCLVYSFKELLSIVTKFLRYRFRNLLSTYIKLNKTKWIKATLFSLLILDLNNWNKREREREWEEKKKRNVIKYIIILPHQPSQSQSSLNCPSWIKIIMQGILWKWVSWDVVSAVCSQRNKHNFLLVGLWNSNGHRSKRRREFERSDSSTERKGRTKRERREGDHHWANKITDVLALLVSCLYAEK